MNDESLIHVIQALNHLIDRHGVMFTTREATRITSAQVEELWIIHGPHTDACGWEVQL